MMLPRAALAALLVAGLSAEPVASQVARLYPVDEAAKDPEFFVFRARLLESLGRRDTAALMTVVAPEIRNSFGGDGGAAEFRQTWRLDRADSAVWTVLAAVLGLGGAFRDDTSFVAPYVFSRFPPSLDGFEHVAVIGSGVRVRAGPDSTAAAIGRLSFDVVRRARQGAGGGSVSGSDEWTPVQLAGGRVGYVASRYLRSPIDYRAYFVRRGGRWVMLSLVAGD
jgi:hypothetical protein